LHSTLRPDTGVLLRSRVVCNEVAYFNFHDERI
jgi:hypothetical protein